MAVRTARKIPRIPKARRFDVTRDEFNRAIEILNLRSDIIAEQGEQIRQLQHDAEIQFKRIAQLQQEIESLKRIMAKLTLT